MLRPLALACSQADREVHAACLCALETDDPAHAESITCQTAALVAYTCVRSLSCDEYDTQPEWDCFGIFLDAYAACDKASRASTLAVETQCEDISPFTCPSGELVPRLRRRARLHGHVRRIRRAMPRMIAASERGSSGERARLSACCRGARVAGAGSSGA